MAQEEIIKQVRLRGRVSTDGKYWNEPKPDNLGIGDIKLTLYKRGRKSYFIKFEPVVYDIPNPSNYGNSTGKNRAYDISAMSYDFEPKPSNDLFKTTDDFVTRFIDDINISIKSPYDWLNPTWDYTTGEFAKYYSGLTQSGTQSLPPFYEIVQDTFDPAVVPSHPEGYFDIWNKWVEETKKPKPQPQVIPDPVVIVDSKLKGDFKFNVEKKDTFVIVGATGGSYSVIGDLVIITEPSDWIFDNITNTDDESGEYTEVYTNIDPEQKTSIRVDYTPTDADKQSEVTDTNTLSEPLEIPKPKEGEMSISAAGLKKLKAHEGSRATIYDDATGKDIESYDSCKGFPTIGVGHLIGKNERAIFAKYLKPGKMSDSEIDNLLLKDLASRIADLNKKLKVKVTQGQFEALLSMGFNTGFGNKSFLKAIALTNEGKKQESSDQINSGPKTSKGKELAGLVRRRKDESEAYLA